MLQPYIESAVALSDTCGSSLFSPSTTKAEYYSAGQLKSWRILLALNPLNAHAAKVKLTWQCVSCNQNQSDKILSMTTLNLLSVLLTITGYKALYFKT